MAIANRRTRLHNWMMQSGRIVIEAGRCGGKPCVRGLRITVYDVLSYLAAGMSTEEILADFPDLEREDILAVLVFAANREKQIFGKSAA
jgi:uncharacterized protein (DUF433 family)